MADTAFALVLNLHQPAGNLEDLHTRHPHPPMPRDDKPVRRLLDDLDPQAPMKGR